MLGCNYLETEETFLFCKEELHSMMCKERNMQAYKRFKTKPYANIEKSSKLIKIKIYS